MAWTPERALLCLWCDATCYNWLPLILFDVWTRLLVANWMRHKVRNQVLGSQGNKNWERHTDKRQRNWPETAICKQSKVKPLTIEIEQALVRDRSVRGRNKIQDWWSIKVHKVLDQLENGAYVVEWADGHGSTRVMNSAELQTCPSSLLRRTPVKERRRRVPVTPQHPSSPNDDGYQQCYQEKQVWSEITTAVKAVGVDKRTETKVCEKAVRLEGTLPRKKYLRPLQKSLNFSRSPHRLGFETNCPNPKPILLNFHFCIMEH